MVAGLSASYTSSCVFFDLSQWCSTKFPMRNADFHRVLLFMDVANCCMTVLQVLECNAGEVS